MVDKDRKIKVDLAGSQTALGLDIQINIITRD